MRAILLIHSRFYRNTFHRPVLYTGAPPSLTSERQKGTAGAFLRPLSPPIFIILPVFYPLCRFFTLCTRFFGIAAQKK